MFLRDVGRLVWALERGVSYFRVFLVVFFVFLVVLAKSRRFLHMFNVCTMCFPR